MKNKFEILCEKYISGQITESLFVSDLRKYLVEVYTNAIALNSRFLSINPGVGVLTMPSQKEIDSLTKRVADCVFSGAGAFVKAQDDYYVREIADRRVEDYDVFFCEDQKFDLGKVNDPQVRKSMNMSLGLETQSVFVQIATKKTNGANAEVCMSTSAVPPVDNLRVFDRRGATYGSAGYSYEDSVYCNRFDASHMTTKKTNGAKDPDHTNFYERTNISGDELALYLKYFKDEAPCPHFHYYRKSVCRQMFGNGKSFAININDLAKYLQDLEMAIETKDKNNPILKYTLGMPFLAIARQEITCDISPFITTARTILGKYNGYSRKDQLIFELYDDLLRTRHCRYENPISQMSSAVNFMSGVSNHPIPTLGDTIEINGDRSTDFDDVDMKKTNTALTALASKLQDSIGETLDEKKVGITRPEEDEPGNK